MSSKSRLFRFWLIKTCGICGDRFYHSPENYCCILPWGYVPVLILGKFDNVKFSKKRKKGKGKNKGNEQVIDMSQFQNIGDEEEKEKETGDKEEKEKEKLGTLHFSLGT